MTNNELQELFRQITLEYKNIFDVYMSLDKHITNYKTTPYYKATKKSIYDAFDLYMRGIGFIDYAAALFKNADENDLINIFERLSETMDIESMMDQWSPENKELLNNLLPFINR